MKWPPPLKKNSTPRGYNWVVDAVPPQHKRHTARGIVVHDGQILLMERWWRGKHYFSLPGGGIEPGEQAEQAVIREIQEETTIVASIERKVIELYAYEVRHDIFLCRYISGRPYLPADAPEAMHMTDDNRFKPVWLPVARLAAVDLFTEALRQPLTDGLANGFGAQVMIVNADDSR